VRGNTVNLTDPSGRFPFLLLALGAAVGFAAGAIFDIYNQLQANGGNWNCIDLGQVGSTAALGALIGGLAAPIIGAIAMLPPSLAIPAAVGTAASGVNLWEQVSELQRLPENQNANIGDILRQVNAGEVALSGIYGAGTTAMIMWNFSTVYGVAASAAATLPDARMTGDYSTFSLFSNSFWGGAMWGVSGGLNNATVNATNSGIWARLIFTAPTHLGIGYTFTLTQGGIDTLLRDQKPSGDLALNLSLGGAANITSVIPNQNVSGFLTIITNLIAYQLSQ